MIDTLDAIRNFLLKRPNVFALTGDRIYAGRNVPPVGYKPSDGQAIAFRTRGGSPEYDDGVVRQSVQIKCYGDTEVEANALYRAVYDDVHNGHSAVVRYATIEQLGSTLEEPDTDWVFVLTFFNFMIRMEVNEYG